MLTDIQLEIMNAVADDDEDLERIYQSITLEFSAERYRPADPSAFYWRAAGHGKTLAEIAEGLIGLVDAGLLTVRIPDVPDSRLLSDRSYVWKGWFGLTEEGRAALDKSRP